MIAYASTQDRLTERVSPAGLRVCVVCPSAPGTSETFIRVHIERLNAQLVHGWTATVDGRPSISPLERLGRRLLRGVSSSAADTSTVAYERAFRRVRPDVVLVEYGDMGVQVFRACERMRLPLVVHFHGYDASSYALLEEHGAAYRRMFDAAAGVIAVSQRMRTDLMAVGCPEAKLYYNPCGVDVTEFNGADPAAAAPVFLAVGRMVDKKGPLSTIAAFKIVHSSAPTARLRMIGDGPLLNACERMIQHLGLKEAVQLLGAQPPEVVRAHMREARAFVQHSLRAPSGDCEGTPVAVLEAGASGLPVVATRHAGIPDVVLDGETGLLVDEGDVVGMAEAMLTLVGDTETCRRMGLAARARVASTFAQGITVPRLMNILRTCAGRPSIAD